MSKFEIKSFRGGKSEYSDRGIFGSFKQSKNLDIRGTEDVIICNQALIADGAGATGADTVVTDLIIWGINASDGNTYLFGDTGKIYKRTSAAVYSLVHTDGDGRITGAYEWYCDNGKRYMFWTTATKLHSKEIPGNATWSVDLDATITPLSGVPQTYPKTNLTSATWHTMNQASGGLMICNPIHLAYVGYDGSYTNDALLIRPGVIPQAVIEYGNDALIGGGDGSRESRLLQWNKNSLNWSATNRIPSKSINAIVQSELTLMSCGDNELFYTDMSNNIPICTLDGKANPGGVVEKGGLALLGLFGGSYSGVWSYGRNKKNESHTLNLEAYIQATEIGAIWKIAEQVFVSYQYSTTHGIKKIDPTTKAIAEYYSLELTAPKESTFTTVELETGTIPTGCSIAVYYDLDGTGSWTQAKLIGDVATATAGQRDPVFVVGSYGRMIELKFVLTPSANVSPTINAATINFE